MIVGHTLGRWKNVHIRQIRLRSTFVDHSAENYTHSYTNWIFIGVILIIYDRIKQCWKFFKHRNPRSFKRKLHDRTWELNHEIRQTDRIGIQTEKWRSICCIHGNNMSGTEDKRRKILDSETSTLVGRTRFIVINWRKLGQYYFHNTWYTYVRVVITVLLSLQYAHYTLYFSEKVVDRKISWRTKWQKVRAWHTLQVKATTRRSNTLSCHGL